MDLILASTSPRRRDLMRDAGYDFNVVHPDAEEVMYGDPHELVVRNARAKARSVVREGIIIGVDTIVACNGEVLGKPVDLEDARRMITRQIANPQDVISGICLLDGGREYTGYEVSGVEMAHAEDLEGYLNSCLWQGKAGAYGIQDRGPVRARVIRGNEDNVIGFPLSLFSRMLSLTSFSYPDRTPG